VLALVDDLMFLSRIREAARGSGVEVRTARTAPEAREAARGARVVFVDLESARLPTTEALLALRAEPDLASLPVVGFLGHLQAERAKEARTWGVTRVLARSAFVQELPALLRAAAEEEK
jgi:CheY-like chemotaxis protein